MIDGLVAAHSTDCVGAGVEVSRRGAASGKRDGRSERHGGWLSVTESEISTARKQRRFVTLVGRLSVRTPAKAGR
jgi:hypothetical protein